MSKKKRRKELFITAHSQRMLWTSLAARVKNLEWEATNMQDWSDLGVYVIFLCLVGDEEEAHLQILLGCVPLLS
jgi:hypothetical protein